jgi:hypothetical protein
MLFLERCSDVFEEERKRIIREELAAGRSQMGLRNSRSISTLTERP